MSDKRPVPTEPGWWWRSGAFGYKSCVKVYRFRHVLEWLDYGDRMLVAGDGCWLAPVATPEEVAQLRAAMDAAESGASALRSMLDAIEALLNDAGVSDAVDTRCMVQVSEHEYEVDGEYRQADPAERVEFALYELQSLRSEVESLRSLVATLERQAGGGWE